MKNYSGFTILEILITLGIVSIVSMFAVPAMTSFTQNERLTTQINTLVGHLALARSEAVLRHQQVVVCGSSDGASCGANWNQGWMVFVDANRNNGIDAGETIVRVQQALEGNNTLNSGGAIGNTVVYDYRGFAPNSIGTFSLCDVRGAGHMKSISISITGRVRQGGSTAC